MRVETQQAHEGHRSPNATRIDNRLASWHLNKQRLPVEFLRRLAERDLSPVPNPCTPDPTITQSQSVSAPSRRTTGMQK